MTSKCRISILIPAYRVKDTISSTVKSALSAGHAYEIIVIDDHCPEASGIQVEGLRGVHVIRLAQNLGKGGAMTEGLKSASGDVIVLLDGDLAESASQWPLLSGPIIDGRADMTIAKFRPATRKGGFGFAKGLAALTIWLYTGVKCESPMSGQRALSKQVAQALQRFESGWGMETAMTIDVHRMGYRFLEVDTDMTHAETGRDIAGFRHRAKQFRAVMHVLVSRLFTRRTY